MRRDNPGKFKDIIMRRLRRGENVFICLILDVESFLHYFCSLRRYEKIETAYEDIEEKDLGFMLFDMDYSDRENIQPMFFRAVIEDMGFWI
jgi:CRISPR-associated protein Cas5d